MNGTFTGADAYGDFARTWETRIGRPFPLAPLSPATIAAFRARSHGFRIRDVMVNGFTTEAALRTTGTTVGSDDHVRLWIVRRGAWHLGDRRGTEHPAPAGRFMAQAGRLSHFTAAPHTTAQVVVLPAAAVPHPRDRMSSGPATAAELRLLTAHADMIRRTLDNLGPAGLDAARDTLIELARAAIQGTVDETEPRLAPALAHAARALADRRLTDPTLSPTTLARHLHVSLRTLQRAFAADGLSVSAYIRDRRLDEARRALTTPGRPTTIAEIAARWQFADSGHFARAFRRRHGQNPTDYAASATRELPPPRPAPESHGP